MVLGRKYRLVIRFIELTSLLYGFNRLEVYILPIFKIGQSFPGTSDN